MILQKEIEVRWRPNNRATYVANGYTFTKFGDSMIIDIKHLTKGSHKKILVCCEECGRERTIAFKDYLRVTNEYTRAYRCETCKALAASNLNKLSFEEVLSRFSSKGYLLISKEYVNSSTKLQYICLRHKSHGIMETSVGSMSEYKGCRHCFIERISGSNHYKYNGGITSLRHFLREHIDIWRRKSMENCDYKCVITGDRFDAVHHIYPFNKIITDTMNELDLPIHSDISDYTDKQLIAMTTKFNEIHFRYPLGVCLRKDIHALFHAQYGNNCGQDDWEEFYGKNIVNQADKVDGGAF